MVAQKICMYVFCFYSNNNNIYIYIYIRANYGWQCKDLPSSVGTTLNQLLDPWANNMRGSAKACPPSRAVGTTIYYWTYRNPKYVNKCIYVYVNSNIFVYQYDVLLFHVMTSKTVIYIYIYILMYIYIYINIQIYITHIYIILYLYMYTSVYSAYFHKFFLYLYGSSRSSSSSRIQYPDISCTCT